MTTFTNILVPLDYEAPADAALRVAGDLARASKGRLLVTHALPLPIYTMTEYPIAPVDGAWIREETERLQRHVRAVLEPDGDVPAFEVDVRVDTATLRILQLAAERRVDVIVMGTHGRSGLKHLLLGSVASKVARLAPCPVLTVPAHRQPHLGALAAEAHAAARAPARAPAAGPGEVGEVMRAVPVTIGPDAMLEEARAKMAQHRVRHLPVVEDGKLVGILSTVDLGPYVGQLARTKVNAAMTPDPTTVGAGVDAATAARLMLERRVRALPVVDGERVVGVISASDILEEYARAARA
ncbi:MAG: universal stress protein [Deltaproteobacteria bacterium]|nr:universal stress protein [Deltaproteobacteria bacterium]